MTTNRRQAGGPDRRASSPQSRARPTGLALLILALVGLAQAGCQFDGCSSCGFGSRLSNGVQALGTRVADGSSRIFRHRDKGCDTCGGSPVEGVVVEPGVPMAPGAMVIPPPGGLVPAAPLESSPSQLDPIPPNGGNGNGNGAGGTGAGAGGANPASSRNPPPTNRSNYEATLPRNTASRPRTTDVARAILSSPQPPRSAYAAASPADSNDMFDHIPPVDVPVDVTRKATSIPAQPDPTPAPASTPPSTANPDPAGKAAAPTPAENLSAAEGRAATLDGRLGPGIRRSGSVAPSIGGGSAPSIDGLDWLKEKGYRTFLDLRSMSEVDPKFVDAVNDRGMVYISLPIVADRLDPSRLARFDEMIAQSSNRPLYFCDSDGTRAGLVWYLHLRTVDGEDPQSASPKAEEIGLTEVQVKLAEAYLASRKPRPKVAASTSPPPTPPAPPPVPAPSAPPPAVVAKAAPVASKPSTPSPSPSPSPSPIVPPRPADAPTAPMLPGENRPQASTIPVPDRFRDPASWRPVAALVLTGFGVPLAYWSKSALSCVRLTRRRASLPGAERRSLDAPAGSDA